MIILFWTEQIKHEKKDFEVLVCQVNSYPCTCWFSMKLKIIGKFCFIIYYLLFSIVLSFFVILWGFFLHCLVFHS